ncbi:MAG: hypothetical protein N2749_00815 [Clostridia bacterium]|nr:hypothetical protein [Clostridia bacterium]
MLIHIDRETGKCILPSPLSSYFIEVPEDFNIFKKIEKKVGEKQKTNDIGEKLFRFAYPENIEDLVEEIAKQYIVVPEDDGTYEEKLTLEKSKLIVRSEEDFAGVEVVVEENTPIIFKEISITRNAMEVKQIEDGFETIVNEEGEEEQIPKYKTVYKDNFIQDVMTIPVGFVNNEPIMEDEIEYEMVSLTENPEYFTLEEVLADKYKMLLLQDLTIDYLVIDTFFGENSIFLLENAHKGQGYIEIEPQGVVKLNSVQLQRPAKLFKLLEVNSTGNLDFYISNKKVVEEKLELQDTINSFSLRIENNTDKPIVLRAICIGY